MKKVLITGGSEDRIFVLHEEAVKFPFSKNKEVPEEVCKAIRDGKGELHRIDLLLNFSVDSEKFTLRLGNQVMFRRPLGCLMGGYADKIHGNEGVRNYLLKLGIKEHEN